MNKVLHVIKTISMGTVFLALQVSLIIAVIKILDLPPSIIIMIALIMLAATYTLMKDVYNKRSDNDE